MPVERKWQRPKISNSYSAVILIGTLAVSSVIGMITGSIIGGIRGGVQGALIGALSGAIFSPLFALGGIGFGVGIAALTGLSTTTGIAISFALATAGSMAWNTYDFVTAKNERERLAAGVAVLFTCGFVAFGAYNYGKISSLPINAKSSNILPNSKGATGEFLSESMALMRGERILGRQITIETQSGVRIKADFVVRTLFGELKLIESKFGPTAKLNNNQKTGYAEVRDFGGTIRGNNGSGSGLTAGTKLGPTDFQLDVWNGLE
jgi:hypothetical protein